MTRREAGLRAPLSGALLAGFALWHPPDQPAVRLCGFHWLTHYDCPFCGLTRSLCAAMKGDWLRAIHLHPLSLLALAWLLAYTVIAVAALFGRNWEPALNLRNRILLATGALFLVVWPFRLVGLL